jgi:hypothetical protein
VQVNSRAARFGSDRVLQGGHRGDLFTVIPSVINSERVTSGFAFLDCR